MFGNIRKAIERGESPNDPRNPDTYRMGKGHVRFFYNKAAWLVERQRALVAECLNRDMDIQYTEVDHLADGILPEFMGDWQPTEQDHTVNLARINERGGLRNGINSV